jgi:hypothetical protein
VKNRRKITIENLEENRWGIMMTLKAKKPGNNNDPEIIKSGELLWPCLPQKWGIMMALHWGIMMTLKA